MRTSCRVLAILGFVFLGTPAIASADWHIAPFLGLTFKGDTTLIDSEQAARKVHWNFGASITYIGGGPVGVEGLVSYTPGFFQQDNPPLGVDVVESRSLAIMGNVVLTTPRSWNEYGLRPFVSGGVGLLRATATDSPEIFPVNSNLLGYNIGGGAVGFLSDRVGLRFDLRYFRNLKSSEDTENAIGPVHLSYWNATVGVVFKY